MAETQVWKERGMAVKRWLVDAAMELFYGVAITAHNAILLFILNWILWAVGAEWRDAETYFLLLAVWNALSYGALRRTMKRGK